MLPLSLLKTAQAHPVLIELKNGETYNGHVVTCDSWMNIHLREVICTSKDGDRFFRMPEVYIRGNTIKYVRVPDEVVDKVKEEQANRKAGQPGGSGRGRGGGRWGMGGRGEGGGRDGGRGGGRGGRGEGGRGGGRGEGGRAPRRLASVRCRAGLITPQRAQLVAASTALAAAVRSSHVCGSTIKQAARDALDALDGAKARR
ncbi:endonuclease [Raphidocelis subcapitata]|uniref:U6 snRNA-associated Sm-like protein LSm4 n=1 Tax=Raphidocelis subcapitata TaxID=307507 RepID=A0A2V0PFQ4_9CHLO|nr:endonuclease [Raphidocelis subcapitata]|eukprot:GBF97842.1 endonuclease [Raphidocelis subcapitata]